MKKAFLPLMILFCTLGLGFGAWKFQIYKKLPWTQSRTPSSQDKVMAEDSMGGVAEEVHSTAPEEDSAEKEDSVDFKVKLHKIEKVEVVKSKPPQESSVHQKDSPVKNKKVESPATQEKIVVTKKSSTSSEETHTVGKDETVWFLATVYYGKGQEFEKILAANKMRKSEDLKEGMVIKIPSPKYSKEQSDFEAHYAELWEKRAKALKAKEEARIPVVKPAEKVSEPSSRVMIPTEKIRAKDKTPHNPFVDVAKPADSPANKAREALNPPKEAHGE